MNIIRIENEISKRIGHLTCDIMASLSASVNSIINTETITPFLSHVLVNTTKIAQIDVE